MPSTHSFSLAVTGKQLMSIQPRSCVDSHCDFEAQIVGSFCYYPQVTTQQSKQWLKFSETTGCISSTVWCILVHCKGYIWLNFNSVDSKHTLYIYICVCSRFCNILHVVWVGIRKPWCIGWINNFKVFVQTSTWDNTEENSDWGDEKRESVSLSSCSSSSE